MTHTISMFVPQSQDFSQLESILNEVAFYTILLQLCCMTNFLVVFKVPENDLTIICTMLEFLSKLKKINNYLFITLDLTETKKLNIQGNFI